MLNWKTVQTEIKKHLKTTHGRQIRIRNLDPKFEQQTDVARYFQSYYPEIKIDMLKQRIEKEKQELMAHKTVSEPSTSFDSIISDAEVETNGSNFEILPNQLMNLPNQLTTCFPDFDKLCLYGLPRKDSFITSIALVTKKDFLFYDNKKQKMNFVKDKKMEYAMCLTDYYSDNSYRLLGVSRSEIQQEIINSDTLSQISQWYIADYYKINIVVISLTNQSYHLVSSWNDEYPIVVMILENNIYMPILNTMGENTFDHEVMKQIKINFKEEDNPLVDAFNKKLANRAKRQSKKKDISNNIIDTLDYNQLDDNNPDDNDETTSTDTCKDSENTSDAIEDNMENNVDNKTETTEDVKGTTEDVKGITEDVKGTKEDVKETTEDVEPVLTKYHVKKSNLPQLKEIAKKLNINLSRDGKSKKKLELMEEILEQL